MHKFLRLFSIGFVFCLLVLAAGRDARAQVITAGYDLLETDSGATLDDFQLPANFFGPGSLPFEGRVFLKGVPFATFDPDGPGPQPTFTDLLPTDTVIQRSVAAGPLYPSTIPIQIVQLSLVSVNPITVRYSAGPDETWTINVSVSVNPISGAVDPPQGSGSMTIRHESAGGGTFDSQLPTQPYLTFTRVGVPATIGPIISPIPVMLSSTGESWSHVANPLIFPNDGEAALVVPGLTSNFFPGCVCAACPAPNRTPVCYSVDGGAFNPSRNGGFLTPLPNPAEGLFQPNPPHTPPNDVYALGTAPGGDFYATEGEVFQSAGAPLGGPPNVSNVDRMSAALGVGPAPPGGPPYMGPFLPNTGAPNPAPVPPGGLGSFGLVPNDNIDALSFGRDSGHVLFFSVDPASVGIPGAHVRREAVTSPFGGAAGPPLPTNPGGGDPGREASGDIFKSLPFAPFGSYIPLHLATGRFIAPAILAANELVIDERLLGLQAPARNGSAIAAPEDNLDALEMSDAGDPTFGVDLIDNTTGVAPPDGIPDRFVFFSIDTASPSNALPGIDPDDILVTPSGGFVMSVFADGPTTMGLLPGDDIDGLALSDAPPFGVLNPLRDEALFSLHPGSTSVRFGPDLIAGTGDEASAADVFYTNFAGTHVLYASAGALGLLPRDNVDGLDIWARDPSAPGGGGGGGGGAKKKLSQEDADRVKHGIRVSQKRRCNLNSTTANFNVTIFAFGTFSVSMTGPSTGMRGATEFNPETGQTRIPIELLTMNLNGNSPLGPVIARAGRELGFEPSLGQMAPLNPTSDFPAQSFFDVLIHVQIGSQALHTDRPFHVATTVNEFPPFGSSFSGNATVQLLDVNNVVVGTLNTATHRPVCVVAADCDDLNACTTDSCNPVSGACQHVALPDTDGDGLCDALDNCKNVANGGQGTLIFPIYPEMIKFTSKNQFCWTTPAAVHTVVGPLANVSSYAFTTQSNDPTTICHPAIDPVPSGGLYYLIELDCPAASWQSSLGMEPARDNLLP